MIHHQTLSHDRAAESDMKITFKHPKLIKPANNCDTWSDIRLRGHSNAEINKETNRKTVSKIMETDNHSVVERDREKQL